MRSKIKIQPYKRPSGGWGAARAVVEILSRTGTSLRGAGALKRQNKPGEFKCVSCAWGKPADPHLIEACESGAKATAWELTPRTVPLSFFADHTLSELESWSDHDLESLGRLTHPLRWDSASDRYVPVSWDAAFAEIGRELRLQAPKSVAFYLCGHASLETAYMYQLLARMFGSNNMPNSSNMCHESTSAALPESIGSPVGTVTLDDFPHTECLFFFGENVGTNAPRMLHDLQQARRRDVPIITFNPIRERGLERFQNPLSPGQMLTDSSTTISTHYYQVKVGGDGAAMLGICKALVAADDSASPGGDRALDHNFIETHTHGFEEFADSLRKLAWNDLERRSGISRAEMERVAGVYARSNATMACYGMGLTQHRYGVEAVQLLCNLMLLRGNIGKPGAGLCPVRGHSNIQGQRSVGHGHKPHFAPLDKLAQQYGFEPPREEGYDSATTCGAIIEGGLTAFVGLGGNFVRAAPDTDALESAWRRLRLTVQIGTKLNRSHAIHGQVQFLLPCLGRMEIDRQSSGPQVVTVEDATGCIHVSVARNEPVAANLRSEPKIVAEIAKAILPPSAKVDWDTWVADYSRIRDAIAETLAESFHDFNARMWTPGGFHRSVPARHREWRTKTGKANFIVPHKLIAELAKADRGDELQLFTLRSNDQFNTTIYSDNDRYRGVYGTRKVLLMNKADLARLRLADGDSVAVTAVSDDGVKRQIRGMRATAYDVPAGCCAGYYPECNPLIPWRHHAEGSRTPAAKSIPVQVSAESPAA